MKDNPKYPGAVAVLLDREFHQDDSKKFYTERFRIKVLKEEGKKYADIVIPYATGRADVQGIRARMTSPDGGSEEFSGPVYDRMIVKSKHVKYQAKAVTLPGVTTGTIIDYSYTVRWHADWPAWLTQPWFSEAFAVSTSEWTLQHELYTIHARFTIQPLSKASVFWAGVRLPPGTEVKRLSDGTAQLELHDIPPLESEDLMPPEAMVNSRVHWYYAVNLQPGTPPELFWHDYGKLDALGVEAFIGKFKSIQRLTTKLVTPSDSPEQKLQKLYARAQQLRFVSYETNLTEQEQKHQGLKENKNVEDVLNRGYAYAQEANYFFAAMARAAGFPAAIVRVVSRRKAALEPAVFDPEQLNATIVIVRVGEKDVFLDPATRFCPYGVVPWFETGVTGIRIDSPGGTFIKIPGQGADSSATTRTGELKLGNDGTLQGNLNVVFSGQEALTHRLDSYDEDAAGRRKVMEDEIKTWLPAGAAVEIKSIGEWEKSDPELRVACEISVPRFALTTGRRVLFSAAVLQSTRTHPFQHPKRTYPVYFRYAFSEIDKLNIELPAGFHVENLPSPKYYTNDVTRFSSRLTAQGSKVVFQRSFSMDGFIFHSAYYGLLTKSFDTVISSDTEKIVLQRVEEAQRQ